LLGNDFHAAGLRAFLSLFLGEGNCRANLESIKLLIEHAVLVKIDVASLRSNEEPIPIFLDDLSYSSPGGFYQVLCVSASPTSILLQLPASRGKSILDSKALILLSISSFQFLVYRRFSSAPCSTGQIRIMSDYQFTAGNDQFDANMPEVAFSPSTYLFNCYPTSHDLSIESA
jgi:hypothetical protein